MDGGISRWCEGGTGVRNVGKSHFIQFMERRISLFVRLFINEKVKGGGHGLFSALRLENNHQCNFGWWHVVVSFI